MGASDFQLNIIGSTEIAARSCEHLLPRHSTKSATRHKSWRVPPLLLLPTHAVRRYFVLFIGVVIHILPFSPKLKIFLAPCMSLCAV